MALKVHKILVGRRFLIVMDDIWSIEVLDYAKILFPDNENGSRIMLTTRLANVAAYADADASALFHEMKLMDADQSFGAYSPLTWITFLLSWRVPERRLQEAAEDCLLQWWWLQGSYPHQIEKILSLSYNHLPLHLKPCFLYMAGFPEDHEIKVTDLIRLWVAEGFVEFEDTAEQYLEDLVDRSLVVVTKRKSDGRIKSCSLHDMFFELFHLRYLAFCYDEQLSRAISNLQNLQALIIKVSLYRPLPHEIWQMPQLRHLIISGDLLLHNLVHLCRLEKLQLELETEWSDSGDATLVAPDSLKKLTLIGWGRSSLTLALVEPQLPRLKTLFIRDCRRLSRIPDDIGEIPTLELVGVKLCAESLAESARECRRSKGVMEMMDFKFVALIVTALPSSKNTSSVRKAKTVIEERPLSYRKSKRVAYGYMKRPKPLIRLDYTDAELKIVNYKEAEPQL
ncbi:toMV susceptible protein tm-2-like [Salvia hispanica]|uniref:toMV susceptible protein tm-2-like n=1 Tax=Salvia hispanica TaxID=49212 RepID=UPI002009C3F3|nr:toMV susceptible protein tm-2-like [Salvia hispanica]